MSIIPVICHNFLRNCSKSSTQSNSINFSLNNSSNNKKVCSTDKVVSVEDFCNMYSASLGSRNNSRGGSCL